MASTQIGSLHSLGRRHSRTVGFPVVWHSAIQFNKHKQLTMYVSFSLVWNSEQNYLSVLMKSGYSNIQRNCKK